VEAGHAGLSPTLTHGRPTLMLLAGLALLWPCEQVLVAMGFPGPERSGMLKKLGARLTERGNLWRDACWMTSGPGVFAEGNMQRG
jgi:NADPH-dependent glutamate synthase beta subunit-like oxidoreductase